jgi:hypothetical protein
MKSTSSGEGAKTVEEAAGDPELISVLGAEFDGEMLQIGPCALAHVHDHVEGRPPRHPHELALGVGGAPEVQAPEGSGEAGAGVDLLHEGDRAKGRPPLVLAIGLGEKAPVVDEPLRS